MKRMRGPAEVEMYLVETVSDDAEIGFVYHTAWLTPEVVAMLESKSRHPASPITAAVKLWPVSVNS